MQLQFEVVFKQGTKEVARVTGRRNPDAASLTIADVTERVIETEQFLEKLTGVRCHINQVA